MSHSSRWVCIQESDGKTHEEYSLKQMKDKFGEEKVEKWLKSGLVQTKPDRITGSTEPSDLEYLIPTSFHRTEDSNKEAAEANTKKEDCTVADLENIENLRVLLDGPGKAGSSSGQKDGKAELKDGDNSKDTNTKVPVKTEPGLENQKASEEFLANPEVQLNKLQKAANMLKTMYSQVASKGHVHPNPNIVTEGTQGNKFKHCVCTFCSSTYSCR